MVDFHLYLNTLIMFVPVFTSGTCITLMAFSRWNCLTQQEKKLKNIVILYLLTTFLSWITVFCYLFFPKAFVYLNIICLAGFVMAPVFFFRLIRLLTRMEEKELFSWLHYLVPALIGAVFLGWSLFVPFDVQVAIVESRELSIAGEYAAYSRLFTSKPLLRMIFLIVYYVCIARLLVNYYRKASRSGKAEHKLKRWVKFLIVISLAFMLSTLKLVFSKRTVEGAFEYTAIAALCISGQFILLTFHIIKRNYLLYTEKENYEPNPVLNQVQDNAGTHRRAQREQRPLAFLKTVVTDFALQGGGSHKFNRKSREQTDDGRKFHSGKLTRRRLNACFRKQKPYLQADFKMTDLAETMDVNRSVLSAFINRNYGINFNRFVNQWRLKELEHLRTLPANKGKSVSQLVTKAGFRDLRQYFRAKSQL